MKTQSTQRRKDKTSRAKPTALRPHTLKMLPVLTAYIAEQNAEVAKRSIFERPGYRGRIVGAIEFFEKVIGCSLKEAINDIAAFKTDSHE